MAGLVNSTQGMPQQAQTPMPMQAPAPQAGSALKNPVLAQIVTAVEAKVSPQLKTQYTNITLAYQKMMTNPKASAGVMQRLKSTPDVLGNIASGVSNFLGALYLESQKRMSLPAAMPASIYVACHVMDLAEQSGLIKINAQNAADCIHATTDATMKVFGVSDAQVHQSVAAGHQAAQQKQPMQAGA